MPVYKFFKLQARIKKIMQSDEEVGKISLATPILICWFRISQFYDKIFFLIKTKFLFSKVLGVIYARPDRE